jgi:3-hydroxyisobutyrate dehydrogenase-like beta-hydroxyacid dehydrogenase
MRIAVLGMGRMGQALATRLIRTGHEVTVWNRSSGRAVAGAAVAADPSEAASTAEIVVSVLADDDAVLGVLLPGDSPLPLAPGALVVDCSTVSPATTRRLSAAYDGRFAASPILGGPSALAAGEAGLAVGGPPAVLVLLDPFFAAVASNVRRCGDDPGLALVVKLINNYLLMAGVAVLSEAVVVGQRAGLEDEFVSDLLGRSPMVAAGLGNRLNDLVNGNHEGWFPPAFGAKDVGLFLSLAPRPPIATLVEARYREAATRFGGEDITAVVELLRS